MELTTQQEDLILEDGREKDFMEKEFDERGKVVCAICGTDLTNDTMEFHLDDIIVCEGCFEAEQNEARTSEVLLK